MSQLTRREEQVLISVWNLRENAYLVAVRKHLSAITGKTWSIGSVHKPLLNLEEKAFLESFDGDATPVRGGRSKKIYRVTEKGAEALAEFKRIHDSLWADYPEVQISK